jgi:hypothetical protein
MPDYNEKVEEFRIEGSESFVKKTIVALSLLRERSPDNYNSARSFYDIIREIDAKKLKNSNGYPQPRTRELLVDSAWYYSFNEMRLAAIIGGFAVELGNTYSKWPDVLSNSTGINRATCVHAMNKEKELLEKLGADSEIIKTIECEIRSASVHGGF